MGEKYFAGRRNYRSKVSFPLIAGAFTPYARALLPTLNPNKGERQNGERHSNVDIRHWMFLPVGDSQALRAADGFPVSCPYPVKRRGSAMILPLNSTLKVPRGYAHLGVGEKGKEPGCGAPLTRSLA